MKLIHVKIKDFRSFAGEHEFDLADGVNYFVGPNNCGKSNLIRAIELALDPDSMYVPERDRPGLYTGPGHPPKTRITLTFHVGRSQPEKTLLDKAKAYELAVRKQQKRPGKETFADDRVLRLVTTFGTGGSRQTAFMAKGTGAASLQAADRLHEQLEKRFRAVMRFGVVHSGEDLESLLAGKFREILQLVLKDHLGEAVNRAEKAREEYLVALQSELLEPLRDRIAERVGGVFTEITSATLVPNLPTVSETLSSVEVTLSDMLPTRLKEKGTGVRGAVLVSMLQYLAEQSRRSLVLVVEEPEAFLHPAAQEIMRDELESLATRKDVTLLVTTHSPYVISASSDVSVTELYKDQRGVTRRAGTAAGHESRAALLGALYRDPGSASIIQRTLQIPKGTTAIVITEGYTDDLFLRACCTAVGRLDVLEGMHFIPAGGATKVIVQAVVARAITRLPVLVLVDNDVHGRSARDKLKELGWDPKAILTLREAPGACTTHDTEIEDLLPAEAVAKLVDRLGKDVAIDATAKCGSRWHLRLSKAWKDEAIESLPSVLGADDPGGMVWLGEELQRRASKIAKDAERARARASAGTP